jgi:hypothetical protein
VLEVPVVVSIVVVAVGDEVAVVLLVTLVLPPWVPTVEVPEVEVTVVVTVCVTKVPEPPVVVPLPKTDVKILVAELEEAKLPPNIPLAASVNVRVVPRLVVLPNRFPVSDP